MPRNTSFSQKLTVLIVIVILFPLITVSIVSAVTQRRNVQNNSQALNESNLESMATFLNVYFDRYKQLTDAMFISEPIQEITQKMPADRTELLLNNRIFSSEIQRITINSFDLEGVWLFCKNGAEYNHYSSRYAAEIRSRCADYVAQQPELTHSRLYVDGFFIDDAGAGGTQSYRILLMRPIFNYKTREYLGVMALEFSSGLFHDLLGYAQNITLLTDADGIIIYDSTGNHPGEQADTIWESSTGGQVAYQGRDYAKTQIETAYGWRIIQLVDYGEVNAIFWRSLLPILALTVISATVFLWLAVVLSKRLVAPIKTLESAMERASAGDLTHHVHITTGDELEHLGDSYNIMLEQLTEHIETAYSETIYRLDAEYRALQSQINPHFLYNTLEYINSLAQINRQESISRMILALADMFRYTTRHSDRLVALSQEIVHVENYIQLQSIADTSPVQVTWAIPPSILSTQTPKLILQPLVENCFIHAFQGDGGYRLCITGSESDGGVTLRVEDNGVGIEPEKLAELTAHLANGAETASKKSIGLANIHKRMRMLLGDDSGLSIESVHGGGCCVTIRIADRNADLR